MLQAFDPGDDDEEPGMPGMLMGANAAADEVGGGCQLKQPTQAQVREGREVVRFCKHEETKKEGIVQDDAITTSHRLASPFQLMWTPSCLTSPVCRLPRPTATRPAL
jgi:hypothetical protein